MEEIEHLQSQGLEEVASEGLEIFLEIFLALSVETQGNRHRIEIHFQFVYIYFNIRQSIL